MTPPPNTLTKHTAAELPARELLERLGWTYVSSAELAAERNDEREMRRDVKDELRDVPDYSAVDLEVLASRIVDMAINRSAR